MANIKSQIKRNRQTEKRNLRNRKVRSELHTRTKSALGAIEEGTDADETVRDAIKRIEAELDSAGVQSHADSQEVHDAIAAELAEFRERAFEPFTRADPARDTRTGTAGLGLAIARGIVTAHDGEVGLGDGPGGVVVITLPL